MSSSTVKNHLRSLRRWQLTTWVLSILLSYFASFLPLFDSSPEVISLIDGTPNNSLLTRIPLLRWDAFHFGHIALHGYVYEYEWAFLPGIPFLMRYSAKFLDLIVSRGTPSPLTWQSVLHAGLLATCLTGTPSTLYRLTLHHLGMPSLAYLTAMLSLIPSSPATLRLVAYTEPFFTFFSYKGMLCCARSQWSLAALYFAFAGAFRSNGFLLGGFILWGLLIDPILKRKELSPMQILHAILLTAVTFVPFISYQYAAYVTFCTSKTTPKAPWCSTFPPSIYTHVQAKYWNIGFLRYWTVSQSPNFLMSAPVLVLLLCFSAYHIRHSFVQGLLKYNQKSPASQTPHATSSPTTRTSSPFLGPSLTPHAIHAFILTSTLIFSAHTQIILRLAASMPFTYWAAAWLFVESENGIRIESEAESTRKETNQKAVAKDRKGVHWGRMWVGWSIVWGAISIVLWTCFLPPA